MQTPRGLEHHHLGEGREFFTGLLPDALRWNTDMFAAAWELHPAERHWVAMFGKRMQTPRWQQAYGADYRYTGSVNNAQPIPELLVPLLGWARQAVDERLNGLLLNWYEGPGDYIGPHHDSTADLIVGAPIVTVSFGEARIFRLDKGRGAGRKRFDFLATDGAVFVMPFDTNQQWKHSVPKQTGYRGRRISVTVSAFSAGVLPTSPPPALLAAPRPPRPSR